MNGKIEIYWFRLRLSIVATKVLQILAKKKHFKNQYIKAKKSHFHEWNHRRRYYPSIVTWNKKTAQKEIIQSVIQCMSENDRSDSTRVFFVLLCFLVLSGVSTKGPAERKIMNIFILITSIHFNGYHPEDKTTLFLTIGLLSSTLFSCTTRLSLTYMQLYIYIYIYIYI